MRTTLALDDELIAEAQRLTGTTEKSALVPRGPTGPHSAGERPPAGQARRD